MNSALNPSIALPAILACLLWSTAFAAVKLGLEHMSPLTLAGCRFILAACLLLPFTGNPRRSLAVLWDNRRTVLWVALFQTAILYALFFIGLSLARGAQAAIVMGASPLVAGVLAHFAMHDDKMTPRKTAGIVLGMVGVVLISLASAPWSTAGSRECIGLGILLLAQCSGITGNILVAKQSHSLPPMLLNSAQIGLGGLLLLALGFLVEGAPTLPNDPRFYAVLLWLALIPAAGFSIWFALLKRVSVSHLNVWMFLVPVFGAALSWLVLANESPDGLSLLGMVTVAAAMVTTQWPSAIESKSDD